MAAGVTDPQLALLETTMLKMERVQTWVLMMGGGSGVDVFLVHLRAEHPWNHFSKCTGDVCLFRDAHHSLKVITDDKQWPCEECELTCNVMVQARVIAVWSLIICKGVTYLCRRQA